MPQLLTTLFPFLAWLRHYQLGWLRYDIAAGLTVALVALPQSIAFALIAGLPIKYGIYAAMMPTLMAGLYGSSRHLNTGPTNPISIVVYSALTPFVAMGYPPETVLLLAFMMGSIQLLFGLFRLGVVIDFISHSVVVGFTAGACVLILVQQLKYALGAPLANRGPFYTTFVDLVHKYDQINPYAVGVTLLTMGTIWLVDRLSKRRFPSALAGMMMGCLMMYAFNLQRFGVEAVGIIHAGWPTLTLPPFSLPLMQEMALPALALALLGLIESSSIAKSLAVQSRQMLNNNKEITGQGLSNLAAAFTGAMPVAGSFSRSAMMPRIGTKTSLTSVFAGLGMIAVVLLLEPAVAYLPLAAIAGMLFMVVPRMLHPNDIRLNLMATRGDGATLIVTFLATLLLKLEFAVYVGVLLSITLYLAKTSKPSIVSVVPNKPGGKLLPDEENQPCPQMGIMALEGSLFFGSAQTARSELNKFLLNHPETGRLLLRMHHVEVLDASGVAVLQEIHLKLADRGGQLALAGCSGENTEVLTNSGLMHLLGAAYVRRNTSKAMEELFKGFSPKKCYACPHIYFNECRALKQAGKTMVRLEQEESPDERND